MGSLKQCYTKHRQEPALLPVNECTAALTEIYRQRMITAAESSIRPLLARCKELEQRQRELIAQVDELTMRLKQ